MWQLETRFARIIIDQVQVLCCETAHGVYVTKRENIVITAHRAAAGPAALICTWHVYETEITIAQTTHQSSSMIVHIFTLEQKKKSQKKTKKTSCTGLEAQTPR